MNKKLIKNKIRPALLKDAKGIANVHIDVWKSTYKNIIPDDFLNKLNYENREAQWKKTLEKSNKNSVIFVSLDETKQIIGFSTAGPSRDKDLNFDGEIWALYLLEQYQGKGIGKGLFLASTQWLKNKNYKSMYVWVLKENPTVHFYKKLGGTQISEKKIEIGITLDEISLGWDLSKIKD